MIFGYVLRKQALLHLPIVAVLLGKIMLNIILYIVHDWSLQRHNCIYVSCESINQQCTHCTLFFFTLSNATQFYMSVAESWTLLTG